MITLYQFAPAWGLPNPSPFCMKLETYLRITNVDYQLASDTDIRKAPKGKLPYIVDQSNGQTIADSNLILDYLRTTHGICLDQHLSPSDQAVSLGLRRLIEENLYWALLHARWHDSTNWPRVRAQFFSGLPWGIRTLVARQVRQQLLNSLYGHGMGRHTVAEIYQIGINDLNALSTFLDTKPYFMGEQPSSLDTVALSSLANLYRVPLDSPLKVHAQTLTNLVSYCERLMDQYFPDFAPRPS